MTQGILFGTTIFILLVLLYTLFLYAKPHKNVVLENTLTDEQLNNPELLTIIKNYKKQITLNMLALAIFSCLMLAIHYDSIQLLLLCFILVMSFCLNQFTLIEYIKKVRQLKESWGTIEETVTHHMPVDTKLSSNRQLGIIPIKWLILPCIIQVIISFILMITSFSGPLLFLIGTFFVCMLLMVYSYKILYSFSGNVYSQNTQLNQAIQQKSKHTWSVVSIASQWFLTGTLGMLGILYYDSRLATTVWSVGFILICLAFCFFVIYYLVRSQKEQDALLNQGPKYLSDNVDYFWRYGFYYNPNDPKLWIPNRIGTQISINVGRKAGKIVYGITALLVVGLIIGTSIPMARADFSNTAFVADTSETSVTLDAPFAKEKEVPWEEITEIKLLNQLPKAVRLNGAEGMNYATGYFKLTSNGKEAIFYVRLTSDKYILIETEKQSYFLSKRTTEETETLYKKLLKEWQNKP